MSEARIHEAPSLPCSGCGAPLPVDPTATHAFCPMCHAWREVPPALRQRAWAVVQAHWQAQATAHVHHQRAAQERERARRQRVHGLLALVAIGLFVMAMGASVLSSMLGNAVSGASSGDLLTALGAVLRAVVFGVVTVALALNGYAVFRLYQRHRARPGRQPSAEWFVQDRSVPAVCGSCGAPLAFKAGEQRVTCGHCRAVVVASRGHGHQLIDLALAQSQIAALEAARAERKRVLAELSARRRTTLMASLLIYGACGVVFIPAFLLAYTLRTITRSAEQQMLDVARDLRGDFRAGLEGLFEWLDAYWIGPAPPDFTRIPGGTSALLESRWCVFAVYHDRPVLLLAWTGITDRALRPYLLLARPRQRGAETIARASRSAAAQRVRQRGFEYVLDYSGVALRGPSMSPDRFDTELVSALAQAAYELAEEP